MMVVKRPTNKLQKFDTKLFEDEAKIIKFKLDGLKGKGLNLTLLPHGNIYIICNNEGILPFMDLFYIICKIIIAG